VLEIKYDLNKMTPDLRSYILLVEFYIYLWGASTSISCWKTGVGEEWERKIRESLPEKYNFRRMVRGFDYEGVIKRIDMSEVLCLFFPT
jgi:hypothetical protein